MSDIRVVVPEELKKNAEEVFRAMGMTMSEAVRIFLAQSVNSGRLPFQPHTRRPNKETIEAMRDAEEGRGESVGSLREYINSMGD